MGVVHEAEDTLLGRRVALKLLTAVDGLSEHNEALNRFRREARALARIDHPGVVTLHDSGVHEGTPYLVMQVLDGMSLADLVEATGPLAPAAVCEVALGVAGALAAAHEAGVLHRDVKPSNVGIGRDGRVVLQDFGLARLAGEAVVTRTGVLMGTPQFIAPETIRGVLPAPTADLYGLGACMYLMITGELPFGETVDVGAVVERALGVGIPRLSGRELPYPEDLLQLVDRLCAQDPGDRPALASAQSRLELLAADGTVALADLLALHIRDDAVHSALERNPGVIEAPEYDWAEARPGSPPEAARPGPFRPPTLSDATRRIVLSSMTPQNALSRQREAVNFVLRGELREVAQMLSVIVPVCLSSLRPAHPTTLTSQYWNAVCLARLGAGGEALELFSQVNRHVGRRTDGTDD